MTFLYSILFLVTPLLLSTANSEVFELPKMYFVYLLTLLITLNHLYGYLKSRHRLFTPHPLNKFIIFFLISQFVSTLLSVNPTLSWFGYPSRLNGGLLSLIAYSLLFLVAAVHFSPTTLRALITKTTLISSVPVVIYGLLQNLGIDKNFWNQDVAARVFSTFGQPNWLATFLCIVFAFALNNYPQTSNKLILYLNRLYPYFVFLVLIYTQSKTGLIAAAVIWVLWLLFQLQKKAYLFSFLSAIGLSLILILTRNPLSARLIPSSATTPPPAPITANVVTASSDIRLVVWQGALNLWRQYPLFGTGPETFADTYYWVRPAAHNLTSEWDFLYNKAHNEYLNYAANTGTFGLLAYLALIFFSLRLLILSRQPQFFLAYISLLINHATGFSIVVSSLYLFLIPLTAALNPPPAPTPPKPSHVFGYGLILLILGYLLPQTILFYLSDLAYSTALKEGLNNRHPQAYTQIHLALSFRPSFPEYLINQSIIAAQNSLLASEPKLKENLYHEAITAADAALKLSPSSLNYWKLAAQTYYYLKPINPELLQLATTRLVAASRLAPTDARLFFLIGEFYVEQKQTDSALTYFQKALDLKPNYDHASFRLGQIYFLSQNYRQAKNMLHLTLKLAPTNTDAQALLDQIPN